MRRGIILLALALLAGCRTVATALTPGDDSQLLADAPAQEPHAIAVDVDEARSASDGGASPDDPDAHVRAVVLADGDSVRILDARLREVRTLKGFAQPAGVAVDAQRRIYVADTGHNRVQRFLPDGTLDASFADQGSLTSVGGHALAAPTTLALGPVVDGKHAGVLFVVDSGRAQLVTCLLEPLQCTEAAPKIEHQGVLGAHVGTAPRIAAFALEVSRSRTDDFQVLLSTGPDVGVTAEARAWSSNTFQRRGTSPSPLQALAGSAEVGIEDTYVMGADRLGVLHEWVLGSEAFPESLAEQRRTALPFPVTCLALDAWGYEVMLRRADAHARDGWVHGETGPLVFYLAGPGHVQRRVFPSLRDPNR